MEHRLKSRRQTCVEASCDGRAARSPSDATRMTSSHTCGSRQVDGGAGARDEEEEEEEEEEGCLLGREEEAGMSRALTTAERACSDMAVA
eukprot:3602267-Rhodomonas_salina.1